MRLEMIGVWNAVASAGPYANNLHHLAPNRLPHQHLNTQFFYRQQALPNAKPTVSKHWRHIYHTEASHTHTHLTAPCPGLPWWAGTRKEKPIWISLKQETVASAGPYASLHLARDRYPRQHPTTQFLQAGCPSCRPSNSVKALKAIDASHGKNSVTTQHYLRNVIAVVDDVAASSEPTYLLIRGQPITVH